MTPPLHPSAAGVPGLGETVRRIEDVPLLTGRGRFTDDLRVPGELTAVLVRSPHAHARVCAVETSAAAGAPGVVAVFVADDLLRDGVRPIPFLSTLTHPSGTSVSAPPLYPLAAETVRHVGEAVAMIVAVSDSAGADAAELVRVEYEPLAAVIGAEAALGPGAPLLWPPAGSNLLGEWEIGDAAACDAAFAGARHTVRLRVGNNAVAPAPLEPRTSIGAWDPATARYTLYSGIQAPHLARRILALEVLGVPEDAIRVVVGDVGGGFGGKVGPYPEDVLVLYAARQLGRPVRWRGDRRQAFLGDYRGRAQDAEVEAAFESDGAIVALRASVLLDVGAYPSYFGLPIATSTGHRIVNGVYDIPHLHVRLRAVLTNAMPSGPYRGAGRPEAIYRLERILDRAARELGLDAVAVRRRNLIPASAMPYINPAGQRYDSGDFPRVLARALAAADWDGFPARREASSRRGRLRGRGLSCHIDSTSGLTPTEEVRLVVTDRGDVEVYSGTQAIGQGIQTVYAQLAAARLGIDIARVRIIQGDTTRVATGGGTYGSRSLHVGGSAVVSAVDAMIQRLRRLAAERLEAGADDVEFERGVCRVVGTDAAIGMGALAGAMADRQIECTASASAPFCFPNGCYVAEVELDPETGGIEVARLVAVDDVGAAVNPMIVEGQVHGGLAQGIGQALWEHCLYDTESGQLLTGSFMDYAVPRADGLPMFTVVLECTPATTNALGAKGAGETGAVGAPPAIVGAVVDALREFGVTHLDMPIRAETVWRIVSGGPRPG